MLKKAFNSLTKIHSRQAQIKRLGNPAIFSPCRVTPSNYFRFLAGPEHTTIRGREFIIPLDTLLGQFARTIRLSAAPASGTFKLTYDGDSTGFISYDANYSQIQSALRLIPGLGDVLVTGDLVNGLQIVFAGFSYEPLPLTVTGSTLQDGDSSEITVEYANTYAPWTEKIRRGDKIVDIVYNSMTIDEIIEICDLGGAIMGYRVRVE